MLCLGLQAPADHSVCFSEGFGNYLSRGGFAERILADLKKFCYEVLVHL